MRCNHDYFANVIINLANDIKNSIIINLINYISEWCNHRYSRLYLTQSNYNFNRLHFIVTIHNPEKSQTRH